MERPKSILEFADDEPIDWYYAFDLNQYADYLERQIKLNSLRPVIEKGKTMCACIDKCMSKRAEYFCIAKRECKHKTK